MQKNSHILIILFFFITFNNLSPPLKFDEGEINSILITHNNTIVVNYRWGSAVQLFSKEGKFIKQIGRKGDGPGEFRMPWHLTEMQNQIIVSDYSARKIIFFNMNGEFKHEFRMDGWILVNGLCTLMDSMLVINDIYGARYKKENNVYLYTKTGEKIKKFGELCDIGKKLWKLNYMTMGPLAVCYKDFIFHANYCDYDIWKYNSKGKLENKFGQKPDKWRSVLKMGGNKFVTIKLLKFTLPL